MSCSTFFVTGTDTGVGKTVVAGLLTRYWHDAGVRVVPLKPVCSGGRGDARLLRAASGKTLPLDEINPWHFRAPLAPVWAARMEGRSLKLAQVLGHVRAIQRRFPVVIIEGAGGLLSPLGADFDSRDLLVALRATPLIVCPNRLGAINQVRLVLEALPRGLRRRAHLVLPAPARRETAASSNPKLLAEFAEAERIHLLPRSPEARRLGRALEDRRLRRSVVQLARSLSLP